jgi:hypothetical protein
MLNSLTALKCDIQSVCCTAHFSAYISSPLYLARLRKEGDGHPHRQRAPRQCNSSCAYRDVMSRAYLAEMESSGARLLEYLHTL